MKANFINGIPELLLLRLLSSEEMYGYQLVVEIKARSEDAFNFGEGCIYPILHRLLGEGYLSSRKEVVDGRPRYYYRSTAKGRKYQERLTQEWTQVIRGAQALLETTYA